ncbi:MAG: S24/S26 family peptidase, partial [Firmicutes bacterium]|nr:S24/S26 family peptidase [Bacillota bacterium]
IGWWALAPTALGGQVTYFTVRGISMLPLFHTGDLVVVRKAAHYRVGEFAAYHYVTLNNAVYFHQIVGHVGQHYIFKGINNYAPDPFHPTAHEIVGRLWFMIPGAGKVLTYFHQPMHAAWLLGGLSLIGWRQTRKRRKRRGGKTVIFMPSQRKSYRPQWKHTVETAGKAGSIIAAGALLVAGIAWMTPVNSTVQKSLTAQQTGTFTYAGKVAPNIIYSTGHVATGMPIFWNLVHSLQVAYHYDLQTAVPTRHFLGHASLTATLSSANGWTHSWVLQKPVAFHKPDVTLKGTINGAALAQITQDVNKLMQVSYNSYQLTVTPHITVQGTMNRQAFHYASAPNLLFSYSN